MYTTNLRKVGGSLMFAVPPALLDLLELQAGDEINLEIENRRLIAEAAKRPHYRLAELLAQCRGGKRRSREEREWLNGKPVGTELL